MKMKIIFFPLSVVVALWVAIGYIKPGVTQILDLRHKITTQETARAAIQQRIDKAGQFSAMLGQNSALEQSVLHYLPRTKEGEAMVDTMNFLANQVGVSVLAMNFTESASPIAAPVVAPTPPPSAEVLALGNSGSSAPVVEEAPVIPVAPQYVVGEVVGNGSYQSIKNFLYRLSHTNRFLSFEKLSVDHVPAVTANQSGQAAPASTDAELKTDSLKVSATVKFTYFPMIKDIRNASQDPQKDVFSQDLDLETAKALDAFVAAASAQVPTVTVSGAGKANPFVK